MEAGLENTRKHNATPRIIKALWGMIAFLGYEPDFAEN
jgi:hypothetical protein